MSSPNEPGYPRAGDGGANGSGSGPGPEGGSLGGAASRGPLPGGSTPERIADATDVPPWQRGPAARAAKPANRPPEAPARPESPARSEAPRRGNGGATGHTPGVDARLNRFLPAARRRRHSRSRTLRAGPTRRNRHGPSSPYGPSSPSRPEPSDRPARAAAGPSRPHARADRRGPSSPYGPSRTPVSFPTCPDPRRARRRASRHRSVPRRNRRAGPRPSPAGRRWPGAIRVRCAPACRSAGSTRGAC